MTIKTILSTALETLKEETFGFWEPCSYGSCFDEAGKLKLAQLSNVAPKLSRESPEKALGQIQTVLKAYEEKDWLGKLWFRWTAPHPIDVYYQLDEIAVLLELNKTISKDGKTLSQAGIDIYKKSRLPNSISWLDKLTEEGWRMHTHAHVLTNIQKKKSQPIEDKDMSAQRHIANEYHDFKSRTIRCIATATRYAAKGELTDNKISEVKAELGQVQKIAQQSLNDYLQAFPNLSNTTMEQKNEYCQSMKRWETFAYDCCDILSAIPPENIQIELKNKASKLPVQQKWGEEILQRVNLAKKNLTVFLSSLSNTVSDKLKKWTGFEEDTKQHLESVCGLYPSAVLTQSETKDTVLGLCYQAHLHEQQLQDEFAGELNKLKQMQQKEKEAAQQAHEDTQKLVSYDYSSAIVECIKYASHENVQPDEIPKLIEELTAALEKATQPKEQVALFSKICLWQNRYLEAASWYCTSKICSLAVLAKEHLQFEKELYKKLALRLHPDKSTQGQEYMKDLNTEHDNYTEYVDNLLKTCFDAVREQTPWFNGIWETQEKKGRKHNELEKSAVEALRTQIARNGETLEKHDKILKQMQEKLKAMQEIMKEIKTNQEGSQSINQPTAPSRVSSYLNSEAPHNYSPGLHKTEIFSEQPSDECLHADETTPLIPKITA